MNEPRYEQLVADLKRKYPDFEVVPKEDSVAMQFLGFLAKPLCRNWLTAITTTIRHRVYMPKKLIGTYQGYWVLRHEAVHVADWSLWFALSYLLVLPCLWTMRAHWEYRGYRETMKVFLEDHGWIPDEIIEWLVPAFTGPTYGFMALWDNKVRARLKTIRDELLKEAGK